MLCHKVSTHVSPIGPSSFGVKMGFVARTRTFSIPSKHDVIEPQKAQVMSLYFIILEIPTKILVTEEGVTKTFTCARTLVGQHVFLQLVGVEGSLSVCEVEVFTANGKKCEREGWWWGNTACIRPSVRGFTEFFHGNVGLVP
jgi:hypothetical protein